MAKFKYLCLTLLVAFLQPPDAVHAQFSSPFPVMYPADIGDPIHINQFFQFHTAEMGFTRVFGIESNLSKKFITNDRWKQIDINSIIYRTHEEKGVLFHFQELTDIDILHSILVPIDRPNNIYRLPITPGPVEHKVVVNHTAFLSEIPFRAKIAFGFCEPENDYYHTAKGYTPEQMTELSKLTKEYCQHPNNTYYIAINAYYMGASSLPEDFEYYKLFYRCHLLLYTMPKQLEIDVPRLKRLLLNKVNLERMLVLVSGRHLVHRLLSLDCVAWGYSKGHYKPHNDELGDGGLSSILDAGTTMIRLPVYKFDSKVLGPNFFFRHLEEHDLNRLNFKVGMVPYLAQVADHSIIALLYPKDYTAMPVLMKFFSVDNWTPFLEARVLRGPNAMEENNQQTAAFWMNLDAGWSRWIKIIFSFYETHGKYTTKMINQLKVMVRTNQEKMAGIRYGIMLEISGMSKEVQMDELLEDPNFNYVFLKDDREVVKERDLDAMREWVDMFANKTVVLVLNDNIGLVNDIYRHFMRTEPNDTSSQWVEDATTIKPTTVTTVETPTEPHILEPETPEPTHPAITNVSTNAKSEGAMPTKREDSWGLELAGMTLILASMLQWVLK